MSEIDIKQLEKSVFNTLYEVDTREREKTKSTGKTELTYLPWATAYSEAAKRYSDIKYEFLRQVREIEETETVQVDEKTTRTRTVRYTEELPYFDTHVGLEVKTRVTINGVSKEMQLPVYDSSNRSMAIESYDIQTKMGKSTVKGARYDDIYKAIMRCFAKNLSMWGIALHLWTKEETAEIVIEIEKYRTECTNLANTKAALSPGTKAKVAEILMESLPLENGTIGLCEDPEVLKALSKKLRVLRKVA